MPRFIRPLGQWRPSRPVAAVLLVVLLALLSVAQLASAAVPDVDLQRLHIPIGLHFELVSQ